MSTLPLDPLTHDAHFDVESRRRAVAGVLDSYHGTYDVPSEALQNAVDAVEDASLLSLGGPYRIQVTVNLEDNWMSFLDTGVGMDFAQVTCAFAPHVSFKASSNASQKRNARSNMYRGFKGIGLTFLAYSTDDIALHSKRNGTLTKARLRYGNAWARSNVSQPAMLVEDPEPSPLDALDRGTYLRVHFSSRTRPKSLRRLATSIETWAAILRTKTAVGQVTLQAEKPTADFNVELILIDGDARPSYDVQSTFLYPHTTPRQPSFRFLDVAQYYNTHPEQSPPTDKRRQDGIYLHWDTERITKALTAEQAGTYRDLLTEHRPFAYAFVPYQATVWREINKIVTTHASRQYLYPGLMIAVNGQRLADIFDIAPSRFVTFSANVFVIIHYHGVKPDHGRKTIDAESTTLAKKVADRIVQYLAKQRASFLRPAGEDPTPAQRQAERDHEDWKYNVRTHSSANPLHIPPVAYRSTPLTEQDVVGLFHQLCALGVFAGARIYATSQTQTYDCLMEYNCPADTPGLSYVADERPFGLSPFVRGTTDFHTRPLTLEFKNNLDGLIADLDGEGPKQFDNIDICVCWSMIDDYFPGYELERITANRLDLREFPGVTHILHCDGHSAGIAVIMLKTVTDLVQAGKVRSPAFDI